MDVSTEVLFALAAVGMILSVVALVQSRAQALLAWATTALALALVLYWWPD